MASSSIRHLRRLSTSAKPSLTASQAKSQLRGEHDPDKALAIYSSVSDKGSSPTVSRYVQDLTVRRLTRSKRFSEVVSFLESHKNDAMIKEESFLSNLIRSYGRAGMFDNAMKTFEEMEALGTPRSAISFNALLSACNSTKLFERVPQLFAELPQRYGFSPDAVSYGILVKAYCEKGSVDKAIEAIGEMEKNGIALSVVTFTTVIDTLYKKGETGEAEKIWEAMVAKGVELDTTAYNVRIGHCHRGKPENVKVMIEEITNAGLKPDTISYNYLITSYCESGLIEEARRVFEGLEGNKCNPNAATFRMMVYYLCKSGDLERAYKVFKKSVVADKVLDFNTSRVLVEQLVAKKRMKEAKGMIRTIKKKFPPNLLNSWKKIEERLALALSPASKEDEEASASASA